MAHTNRLLLNLFPWLRPLLILKVKMSGPFVHELPVNIVIELRHGGILYFLVLESPNYLGCNFLLLLFLLLGLRRMSFHLYFILLIRTSLLIYILHGHQLIILREL